MSIKDNIEKYKEELCESIKRVKDLRENTIKNTDPKIVRDGYDSFYDSVIIKKRSQIKDAIQTTETDIKSLKECIELLNTLNNEIDTVASIINKIKVGTLEGISRQVVKLYLPKELTEIDKEILNKSYDELTEIFKSNGGKKV